MTELEKQEWNTHFTHISTLKVTCQIMETSTLKLRKMIAVLKPEIIVQKGNKLYYTIGYVKERILTMCLFFITFKNLIISLRYFPWLHRCFQYYNDWLHVQCIMPPSKYTCGHTARSLKQNWLRTESFSWFSGRRLSYADIRQLDTLLHNHSISLDSLDDNE